MCVMASQGMPATERTTRWVELSLSPDTGPVEGCGLLQGCTHQDRTKAIRSISYLLSVVLHRCHSMDDQTRTEADAVHEQTLLGIEPVVLNPGCFYAIRTTNGYKTIDLTTEATLKAVGWNRERPVSRYAFHNTQSFVSYVKGIFTSAGDDDPNAYNPRRDHAICIADETAFTIRLIFDAQPYEWGDVYTDLKLQTSPEDRHKPRGRARSLTCSNPVPQLHDAMNDLCTGEPPLPLTGFALYLNNRLLLQGGTPTQLRFCQPDQLSPQAYKQLLWLLEDALGAQRNDLAQTDPGSIRSLLRVLTLCHVHRPRDPFTGAVVAHGM